jgi:hypothetical protein
MPQVKAAAIGEILRSGSPQILVATIATCPVTVANAKHVRTLASLWSGHCLAWPWSRGLGRFGKADPVMPQGRP